VRKPLGLAGNQLVYRAARIQGQFRLFENSMSKTGGAGSADGPLFGPALVAIRGNQGPSHDCWRGKQTGQVSGGPHAKALIPAREAKRCTDSTASLGAWCWPEPPICYTAMFPYSIVLMQPLVLEYAFWQALIGVVIPRPGDAPFFWGGVIPALGFPAGI